MEFPAAITALLAEAEALDPNIYPPRGEAGKVESSLGTAPESSRKLWALHQHYAREFAESEVRQRFTPGDYNARDAAEQEQKSNILRGLFFFCVRTDLKCMEVPHIGLRKDWVVVSLPCEHDGGLPPFLQFLGRIEPPK